jgi:hypothetical protein
VQAEARSSVSGVPEVEFAVSIAVESAAELQATGIVAAPAGAAKAPQPSNTAVKPNNRL